MKTETNGDVEIEMENVVEDDDGGEGDEEDEEAEESEDVRFNILFAFCYI